MLFCIFVGIIAPTQNFTTTFCESNRHDADRTCFSPNATFAEAHAECARAGMRLCSLEEVKDARVCCGTGCSYNSKLIWTTATCILTEVPTLVSD